jgi:hypothetical protein
MTPRTGRPLKRNVRVHDLARVTVRLRPETKAALFALAKRSGVAVYELVELAVSEFMARARGRGK